MNSNPSHPVIVGQVAGVFGVKGWLKIRSETQPISNILNYSPWYLKQKDDWLCLNVIAGQPHGKGLIAQLEGVNDRDAAAALMGCEIAIDRQQLPDTEEGEYYWSDLIGLEVQNLQGSSLGTIVEMMQTGANDVMVIRNQEHEYLVPFVMQHYVMRIDLDKGLMLVDWPWLGDDSEPADDEIKE